MSSGRDGALIALVGPDGVGKTTIARSLLSSYPGSSTGYVHFRPPLTGALPPVPPPEGVAPPKVFGKPSPTRMVAGWIRLIRSLTRFWVGYVRTVRPALRRGALVVADRWGYGYVAQPLALKFYGPDWLARLFVCALPKPDLLAVLTAPPDVVHARKRDLTVPEIEAELHAWQSLSCHGAVEFDSTAPPDEIAQRILAHLE